MTNELELLYLVISILLLLVVCIVLTRRRVPNTGSQ
jgi:hypothetical protein